MLQSKMSTLNQPLSKTRVVAQEVVQFLETTYRIMSFVRRFPSCTVQLSSTPPVKETPLLTQRIVSVLATVHHTGSFLKTLFLFTASDFPTFAIPTVLFGFFSALSGSILTTAHCPSILSTLMRIPSALLLIWANLLIFNISNQRTPSGVEEDMLNKPHRPIAVGRISIEQARQVNLALVPIVLSLSWFAGVWHETLILLVMQWMYNDLQGCDESLLLRNGLIAIGYGLYSAISLSIMIGKADQVTFKGYQWIGVITLIMFTTQHICDIKDAPGDTLRGRRSAPIVLGDAMCRWSVAVPVMLCAALCPAFFGLGLLSYVFTLSLGLLVAGRTLTLRDLESDKLTWKLWALWTCSLFVLPLITCYEGLTLGIDGSMLWQALMHYVCPGYDCVERLNVVAVSGIALAVKGSSTARRTGSNVEGNVTMPGTKAEGAAA